MSLEEEMVFKGNGRQGNYSTWNNAAVRMDLMGFHPATLFVHLGNNSQMPNKLLTTKSSPKDLGLLRQTAEIGSYRKGWTQVSWGTIPSRTSTEKSSRCLKVLPSWKHQHNATYPPKTVTGNLWTEFLRYCTTSYHLLSLNIHLLPRDMKEESLYTCECSWVPWWQPS